MESATTINDPLSASVRSDVYDWFDLIFQHLSWRNLLTSSEVSSNWYQTIGASPHCMNKIKINISNVARTHERDLETLNAHLLINMRQYRNIYADFFCREKRDIIEILRNRRWKNVHLLSENFEDGKVVFELLQTVNNLTLSRINCDDDKSRSESKLLFPQLKCLRILSCNDALLKNLEECSTLTELLLSCSESTGESFAKFLINNKNLKKLTVFVKHHRTILPKQVISQIEFKLSKLVIDSFDELTSDIDRERLQQFLENQTQWLVSVNINPWSGSQILKTCLQMPKLEDFSYSLKNREDNLDWKRMNLATSDSIKRFHIRSASPRESLSFYDTIFAKLPNLRIYKAKWMHFEDLFSLSLRCKNIEELYVENFNVNSLPNDNCFPNIKRFKSWDTSDDLMRSLTAKGAKNYFEELILGQGLI